MNYLGLIAICLGLISILVSIQYMNSTNKILEELKYIRNKCINTNETFKNYKSKSVYKNLESRGFFQPKPDLLGIGKINELKNTLINYDDLFNKTFERVMKFDKSYKFKNNYLESNLKTPKPKWCKMLHDNKSYCFSVPSPKLCKTGEIVFNTKKCDYH